MEKVTFIFLFLSATCYAVPVEYHDHVPMFMNGRPKGGFLSKLKIDHPNEVTVAEPQWFVQKLNHFDDSDSRTWKQKYYVNASVWRLNGPVFLMIGGEGLLNPLWLAYGTMAEYAAKYGALMVALEHRFYGDSHPLGDASNENLKYLSSEQALADVALFRNGMALQFGLASNNRYITFGGSYAGTLAAWFRYKYPHLTYGAIASSAPIESRLDFTQYLEVSTASLGTETCRTNVGKATKMLESHTKTENGLKYLKIKFQTCDALNSNDIPLLGQSLADNFFNVIQYNKQGSINPTIETLCDIMSNASNGNELQRYAAVNDLMMKTYGQTCLDSSYDGYIDAMRRTTWESPAVVQGGRQWIYQSCTEFGFFQTTDSKNQVFGSMFPLSVDIKICFDIFGIHFNGASARRGTDWSNTNYGKYAMSIDKIVFPNGSIDPWHALSFIKDGKKIKAIYIKGGSHCQNMQPSSTTDSQDLADAKEEIKEIIGKWLLAKPVVG